MVQDVPLDEIVDFLNLLYSRSWDFTPYGPIKDFKSGLTFHLIRDMHLANNKNDVDILKWKLAIQNVEIFSITLIGDNLSYRGSLVKIKEFRLSKNFTQEEFNIVYAKFKEVYTEWFDNQLKRDKEKQRRQLLREAKQNQIENAIKENILHRLKEPS